MLDASTDGNRHFIRRKVGYLIGGYISGGLLSESEALSALEPAVRRNTKHLTAAWKTLTACLEAGKAKAIRFDDLEHARIAWRQTTFPEKSGAPSHLMVEVE